MARLPLSQLPGWKLANPKQDLRGLQVVNQDGNPIGTVTELLVNTLTDLIDGVVLDNGESLFMKDLRPGKQSLELVRRRR